MIIQNYLKNFHLTSTFKESQFLLNLKRIYRRVFNYLYNKLEKLHPNQLNIDYHYHHYYRTIFSSKEKKTYKFFLTCKLWAFNVRSST